eukprot:5392813-Pyramimonas_sp.AAC.1
MGWSLTAAAIRDGRAWHSRARHMADSRHHGGCARAGLSPRPLSVTVVHGTADMAYGIFSTP